MAPTPAQDHPPSEKQIASGEWLAHYKGVPFPNKARSSNNALWAWVNRETGRIEREDARAAKIDFGLDVDFDSDPFEIIGALKYRDKARWKPPVERAVEMMLQGIHPYTVEEALGLTEEQREEAESIVMAEGYEIDWGSN